MATLEFQIPQEKISTDLYYYLGANARPAGEPYIYQRVFVNGGPSCILRFYESGNNSLAVEYDLDSHALRGRVTGSSAAEISGLVKQMGVADYVLLKNDRQ